MVFLCAGVFSISNCCRKRSPASPAALVDTVLTQQLLPTLLSYHCQGRAAAGFKHRHWCVLWVLFWKWWQSSPAELFSEITLFSFGFHFGGVFRPGVTNTATHHMKAQSWKVQKTSKSNTFLSWLTVDNCLNCFSTRASAISMMVSKIAGKRVSQQNKGNNHILP